MRTFLSLLIGSFLALAIGCGGKGVTVEQVKQLKTGMSPAEIEAILGKGTEEGGATVYGNSSGKLTVTYVGGKMTNWKYEGQSAPPSNPEQIARQQEEERKRAAEVKKAFDDPFFQNGDIKTKLQNVFSALQFASGGQPDLPANKVAFLKHEAVQDMPGKKSVESGEIEVRWGVSKLDNDVIWAYEKDAPTKGGHVVGTGEYLLGVKLTAEQLQAKLKK